jgi:hypothetical protein
LYVLTAATAVLLQIREDKLREAAERDVEKERIMQEFKGDRSTQQARARQLEEGVEESKGGRY